MGQWKNNKDLLEIKILVGNKYSKGYSEGKFESIIFVIIA